MPRKRSAPSAQKPPDRQASGGPCDPVPPAAPRVLVAEDNPINRMYLTRALEARGCAPLEVPNARAALDLLSRGGVDLVLMDISMPGMDGMEAARRIRRGDCGETARGLPLVAVTAHAAPQDGDSILAAGFDALMLKPLSLGDLGAVLERFGLPLSGSRHFQPPPGDPQAAAPPSPDRPGIPAPRPRACAETGPPAASPATAQADAPVPPAASPPPPAAPDISELMRGLFLRDTPGRLAALEEAVAAGNRAWARTVAHYLVNSAIMLGAEEMRRLGSDLEDRLEEEAGDFRPAMEAFRGEVRRVLDLLDLRRAGLPAP